MVAFQRSIQDLVEKGQGPAGRALDRLPTFAQESLVKMLGYPYQFPQLDSFTKCLMAAQPVLSMTMLNAQENSLKCRCSRLPINLRMFNL